VFQILLNAYSILFGKPERKRPLRRPRHRWEDNIRMDLMEIGWERCGLDSSGSGQEPMACCFEHSNEHLGSMNGGKFLD
jgi:hypothetical protein